MGVVLVPGQDEREGEDLSAGLGGLVGQVVATAVGRGLAAEQVGDEAVAADPGDGVGVLRQGGGDEGGAALGRGLAGQEGPQPGPADLDAAVPRLVVVLSGGRGTRADGGRRSRR